MTITCKQTQFRCGRSNASFAFGAGDQRFCPGNAPASPLVGLAAACRPHQQGVANSIKAKNAGTSINGEFLGWADYWPRLATQVAGRNAPDIIQMDYRYIVEYARRGALAPLESYMPSKLKLDDFDPAQIEGGKVDGHLYGVSLGANSAATVLNASAFEEAGIDMPTQKTTWEEFGKIGAEMTKAGKRKGYFGFADGSGRRTAASKTTCASAARRSTRRMARSPSIADEASEWFDMWAKFREAGACVTPDIQALYKDSIDTSPLTVGKAAAIYRPFQPVRRLSGHGKDKLALTNYMRIKPDSKGGHYRKPSMFFSVSAQSKVMDQAVDYVELLRQEPGSRDVLDVERGIPESKAMREVVATKLDETGKIPLDLCQRSWRPRRPAAAAAADRRRRRPGGSPHDLRAGGFGQLSPSDAGKQLVDEITRHPRTGLIVA